MRSAIFNHDNNLAIDRQSVTDIFTNKKVIWALRDKGVRLIGYADIAGKK